MLASTFLALGLACLASADLVIREAGRDGKIGPTLKQGGAVNEFCPKAFSTAGFSIECTRAAAPVYFYVDGSFIRTERRPPYLVATNTRDDRIIAWDHPGTRFLIQCRSRSGGVQSARVHIVCPVEAPPMEPTMAPTEEPSEEPTPAPPVREPAPPVKEPALPAPEPTPPVQEPAPPANPAPPTPAPPTPAPPTPAPAPPVVPAPPVNEPAPPAECVKMTASAAGELSAGWTREGESIWFKKDSTDEKLEQPGVADVVFRFVAPATGSYGIALDMTTAASADHNGTFDCLLFFLSQSVY